MTDRTPFPEVWGKAEVAEHLGRSTARVAQLAHEPGFPEPVARLRAGWIWLADDIRKWSAEHPRRPLATDRQTGTGSGPGSTGT